jgi:hypothetical protein
MRKLALVMAGAVFSFSLLSLEAQRAFAQGDSEAPAAPPAPSMMPPQGPGPVLVPVDEPPPMKQFAIVLNPLATGISRYSIQGEYLPALHHAITLNPFYTHASIKYTAPDGTEADLGSLSGFGGELGYRFYSGSKGPNGFFVGPSFLFASYSQSGGITGTAGTSSSSDSFTSFGGAIDIGGQGVIGPGIVIGGGFGLQWTKNSRSIDTNNLNLASAIIAGGGTRPRFLFSIGYAF